MRIHKLDPAQLTPAYGIHCQHLALDPGGAEAPFGATLCLVRPGEVARAHRHHEAESFVVVRGRGRMRIGDETAEVGAGDTVVIDPFADHELANLSADDDLLFLDLVWEDLGVFGQAAAGEAPAESAGEQPGTVAAACRPPAEAGGTEKPRVLVTATPPTPNGDLHVGHLAGPYLSADMHARYLGMRGAGAYYLSGVDDHQSYTEVRAMRDGATARAVADHFGDAMEGTLERAGVGMDLFARPRRSPYHVEMVQEVFRVLHRRGALVAREAPTLWCERCRIYLFEAHVVGRCPHCGELSNGNACEACGRPNDCVDLAEAHCKHCGRAPAMRPLGRFYFPLAPWADRLRDYWASARLNPHLRSLCERMLADGLPDIAVSQVTGWGIPVPVAGFEDQRIYVWFEMGPGYLAATQELLDSRESGAGWRRFWTGGEREVVQFFGFDNGYFHAVLFPATYFAYDQEIRPPGTFVTNEFYRYEGAKFSTSRNHAMWGRELLDRVPRDVARFYLAYDCPEREQSNFTLGALEETVARELAGRWEPWLSTLAGRVADEFGGRLPATGAWTPEHRRFFADLVALVAQAAAAYEAETFSPQRAARTLTELVRTARRFAAAEEHWRGVPSRFEERRTAVALEALAAKALAMTAAPMMPEFAAGLWRDLGYDGPVRWEEVPAPIPSGRDLSGLERPRFGAPARMEEPARAAAG